MIHDKNVKDVINKIAQRELIGRNKYGVTTERDDVDIIGWVTHLQEELMDASIYAERIKKDLLKMQDDNK